MAVDETAPTTAAAAGKAGAGTVDHAARREAQLARRRRMVEIIQGQGLLVVFGVVFATMWISSPYFFTVNNLTTAAGVVSVLGVMAVTETMVIIMGEIDVSIGSVMALTSVLIGMIVGWGANPWIASLLAAAAAAVVGLVNGILVVFFKVNSLVVTLGTYSIALGIAYMLSNSSTVLVGGSGFEQIGSGNVWKIPVQVFIFLGVWALGYFVLRFSALGRHIYAVGNNYDAALRAGIRADLLRIGLFVTVAISAALAGIIVTSELSSAAPQVGDPYLLAVVTAAILGGASLAGGRGTLVGTLIAVGILGVLQNGFALLSLSVYTQYMVIGVLLILAVLTDQLARRAER
jgi:ribose transport system permease protein